MLSGMFRAKSGFVVTKWRHDVPWSWRCLSATEIVAVWPELPGHIKAAIKALVQLVFKEISDDCIRKAIGS